MVDVVKKLIVTTKVEGAAQTQTDLNGIASAYDKVAQSATTTATATEQASKSGLSIAAAYKRQTMQLDEAARAQDQMARATKVADTALKQGLITQQEHAQRLDLISNRYTVAGAAAGEMAKGTGLARHEMVNLSRQAQDIGVSLASGQSLFTVLVQQGAQVADVFASSQGTVRGFFDQAIGWAGTFLKSTTGIVTSVLAVGGAALYAAYQFASASTTIEQALEEQNRLLKEGKALLDARTSAEARSQLQSKEQTQFETLRNQLDLQIKLNAAMEEAARFAASRAGTPTGGGMPEMGIAPSGVGRLKDDPGYDQIIAAHDKLKAATAAGLPGLREFNAELAKVGLAHPELAMTVAQMIKAGEAGMELERAAQRAKAMSDALKGIATDAQLAAVGLNSVAQFKLNNLQAEEAKESTERQAVAILKIRENWGGVSVETAKVLEQQQNQFMVAKAVTGQEKLKAQEVATTNELYLRGVPLVEAQRIAASQTAIAQAQINSQAQEQLLTLQDQYAASAAVTGQQQMAAQHAATYNALIRQGVDASVAMQVANQEQANTQARINAAAEQQLFTLQNQQAVMGAINDDQRIGAQYQATINRLTREGVDLRLAEQVATQEMLNARTAIVAQEQRQAEALERRKGSMDAIAVAWQGVNQHQREMIEGNRIVAQQIASWNADLREMAALMKNLVSPAMLDLIGKFDSGVKSQGPIPITSWLERQAYQEFGGPGNIEVKRNMFGMPIGIDPKTAGWEKIIDDMLKGGGSTEDAIGRVLDRSQGGVTQDASGILRRLTELQPEDQRASTIQRQLDLLNQQPATLARNELMKQLTDSLKQLQESTSELNDTMKITLDPLFTGGHSALRIGFYNEGGSAGGKYYQDTAGLPTATGVAPIHAAGGFEGMVTGGGGVDDVPFHAMLSRGEQISIRTPEQARSEKPGVVVNTTQVINFPRDAVGERRRTYRQLSEGFAAIQSRGNGAG